MSTLSQDLLNRSHAISVADAQTLITHFASCKTDIITGDYSESEPLPNAESFNKEALLRVLEQEGCIGIRFYLGFTTSDKVVLVGTGIDEDGNDLNLGLEDTSTGQELLQGGQPCPTLCPDESKINS